MLHEINFLDWRRTQRRRVYRRWFGMSVISLVGLVYIELNQYHLHRSLLFHAQQSFQQELSAYDMVNDHYQKSLLHLSNYEELRQNNARLNSWVLKSQNPSLMMKLVQSALPLNVYLDRLRLAQGSLMIGGIAESEHSVTEFVNAMSQQDKSISIERMQIDKKTQRWQRGFYPFEIIINLSV